MATYELFNFLSSEVGGNTRRVVRQIPEDILNNTELQDAVRQVIKSSLKWIDLFLKKCALTFVNKSAVSWSAFPISHYSSGCLENEDPKTLRPRKLENEDPQNFQV